jgi:integrase
MVSGRPLKKDFASEDEARAWLDSREPVENRLGKVGDGSLGAWLIEWLENPGTLKYRRRSANRASTISQRHDRLVSDKTMSTYRSLVVNHWLRHPISKKPLGGVLGRDVDAALDQWDREGRVSRTTITHLRRILSAAYTAAGERDLVVGNPVTSTGGRPSDPNRVEKLRLTEDLARRIEAATKGTPIWCLVVLMINTGLRLGEALALDWEDVKITVRDRDGEVHPGFVTVRRALLETKWNGRLEWFVGVPKTARSRRDVWFDQDVVAPLMKAYREAGRPKRGIVFAHPAKPGQPDNPQRVSKLFSTILTEHEIELRPPAPGLAPRSQISIRDLRSLHVSIQIRRGAPIAGLSKRIGHSDSATTLRHYVSVPTEADVELGRNSGIYGQPHPPKGPEKPTPKAGRRS